MMRERLRQRVAQRMAADVEAVTLLSKHVADAARR